MAEALTADEPQAPEDAEAPASVAAEERALERPEASSQPPRARQPGAHDHRCAFRLAFAGLALILAAAIAGTALLLARPSGGGAPDWSDWQPSAEGDVERAQEIAGHVAVEYRLPSGQQLVTVQAEAPEVQSIPIDFIAIESAPGGTVYASGEIPVFRDANDKGIQYLLCGLGPACSIAQGQPSVERQRLLRREALELALYTFRYIEGRDYVVVYMPPKPGDRPTYALFFERRDLSRELAVPLRRTLPEPRAPLTPESLSPREGALVDRLTNPHFFGYTYSQLQNQQVVLVLLDPAQVTPQPLESSTQSGGGSSGTGGSSGGASGTAGAGAATGQ